MEPKSNYIQWNAMSDQALAEFIGNFVRSKRIEQNKTQAQLAHDAGISRSTLALLEKGSSTSLSALLQVLRMLNQLHVLAAFETTTLISPLQFVKEAEKKRRRVRGRSSNKNTSLDW